MLSLRFCAYMDGCEKFKPIVIGKNKNNICYGKILSKGKQRRCYNANSQGNTHNQGKANSLGMSNCLVRHGQIKIHFSKHGHGPDQIHGHCLKHGHGQRYGHAREHSQARVHITIADTVQAKNCRYSCQGMVKALKSFKLENINSEKKTKIFTYFFLNQLKKILEIRPKNPILSIFLS